MKKRLFTAIFSIAIGAAVILSGVSFASATAAYGEPLLYDFSAPYWFENERPWAEHIKEDGDNKVISLADTRAINGMGNWDRFQYGQELVQTPTEQYLRLYDQPSSYAYYNANTSDSNFYFFTDAIKQSVGINEPLIIKFRLRKVGEGWANASGVSLKITSWSPSQSVWGLVEDYTNELAEVPVGEWAEIEKAFIVPEIWADVESVQVQFVYGAKTDVELQIACISSYVPIDTTNVPEVNPQTATFNGANPEDVTVSVALKDFSLSPIKLNDVAVNKVNYSLSADKTELTFKKEYLKTLENGENVFSISTPGGECTLTVTVINNTAEQGEQGGDQKPEDNKDDKGGCGGVITLSGAALSSALLLGAIALFKKR